MYIVYIVESENLGGSPKAPSSVYIHDYEVNLTFSLGLDKIYLAKFEQNGQPKERSNSASNMGRQFCQKSKMGKERTLSFWIACGLGRDYN